MTVSKRVPRSSRRFTLGLGLGIALIAAALVPATASAAKLWEGKWKYHVEGGGVGRMCLDQQGDYVEGKYQSSEPGKYGIIDGRLYTRRTVMTGNYKDRGTGDKGGFRVEIGEGGKFDGYFYSSSDSSRHLDWGGHQVDFDGGYNACVRSIKD